MSVRSDPGVNEDGKQQKLTAAAIETRHTIERRDGINLPF